MSEFNNYTNPYETRQYITRTVVPSVLESLLDAYDADTADEAQDYVWEIIDSLEEVIYNYQSKQIALAYGYCPFTTESEFTGERFNSWNEMAFEIIYNKFYEAYDLDEIFETR